MFFCFKSFVMDSLSLQVCTYWYMHVCKHCAVAVNGTGNSVPPMFVFPRKKFQDHFIQNGPPGCTGTANGSGWMQEADFLVFMKHFAKHVRPSKQQPVLLTFNNHGSHLSIEVLDFCVEQGITLLSFPPHTSYIS